MKFTAPKGKVVNFKGKLLFFKDVESGSEYSTDDKKEQEVLKSCKNVKATTAKAKSE